MIGFLWIVFTSVFVIISMMLLMFIFIADVLHAISCDGSCDDDVIDSTRPRPRKHKRRSAR